MGIVSELEATQAAAVLYLRLWNDGPQSRAEVQQDLRLALGEEQGHKALQSFEQLCRLFKEHCRRPLMRHSVTCKCLGADEACFANFVAIAAEGDREDAMLIATLLVRADMAPAVTMLASELGLALKRMCLSTQVARVETHAGQPGRVH